MATQSSGRTSRWTGIAEKLHRYFSDENCDEAPHMEQLEGRVLLSANPLSELTDRHAPELYDSDQVIHVPLASSQSLGPATRKSAAAVSVASDTTAPTITSIVTNKEIVRTFDRLYFIINATDAGDGIANYQLTINGQAISVDSHGESSYFTFQEAGINELVATVTDWAGNVATHATSMEVAESPDVRAPSIYIALGDNSVHNRDVSLMVSVSDDDSSVINWTATLIDNATGQERVLASGDRATSFQLLETIAVAGGAMDGSYTLRVEAVDKGGNVAEMSRTFTIDTIPPEVELVCNRAEVGVVFFDFLATDASGIWQHRLNIDGRQVNVSPDGRAQYTFTKAGEYDIKAWVTDNAGNVTTVNQTIVIGENTDHTGPTVEIVSPAANAYINGNTDIILSIADAEREYVSWKVTTISSTGATRTSTGTGGLDNQAVEVIRKQEDGPIRIIVEATDAAGNVTVVERTVIMDTVPPRINLSGIPAHGALVKDPYDVTGVIGDAGSPTEGISWTITLTNADTGEVVKRVEGKGTPPDGVFAHIDPAEYMSGDYWIIIEAVDLAGNKADVGYFHYMDGKPPTFICNPVLEGSVLKMHIYGNDDSIYSLNADYTLLIGPEGVRRGGQGWIGNGEWATMSLELVKGYYLFEVTVFDKAGNQALPMQFEVWYDPDSIL